MFERYTEAARRALFFARFESSHLGSLSIAPEHLLLGLIRDGAIAKTLPLIPMEALRREIESRIVFQRMLPTSAEIPFTEATVRVLTLAVQEADDLRANYIGCEHLLLGLLRDDQSAAASVLAAHGVRLDDVRTAVAKRSATLDGGPRAIEQVRIAHIKEMVAHLARTAPDTPEAATLVTAISATLDQLLGDGGIG